MTYDYEHLLHGEAVAIGMVATSWMGAQAHLTDSTLVERQCALLDCLGLPITIPSKLREGLLPHRLAQRIKRILDSDKKRTPDGTVWIVPTHLGEGICTTEIGPDLVTRCLRRLADGAVDG